MMLLCKRGGLAGLVLGMGSILLGCVPPAPEDTPLSREQVLSAAEASPAAVAIHDKAAWLELFANRSSVEDPVGTAPHRTQWSPQTQTYSKQPLDDFYDTFIAPNDIRFHVHQDIIAGNEIVRDVDIETHMSTGLVVTVPTHLRYRIISENGQPKIQSLAAHWELNTMITQVLGDAAGLSTGAEMTARMLQEQGVAGALGYLQGMTMGIFDDGKAQAQVFASAFNGGDLAGIQSLFHKAQGQIEFPVAGRVYELTEFGAVLPGAHLSLGELTSAGWYTSARFQLTRGTTLHEGIVFFRYDELSRRLRQVRFFWEP